jgi:hypothetical protein
VFDTISIFENGGYTLDEAMRRLMMKKRNNQICINDDVAINTLIKYVGAYKVSAYDKG